MTSLQVWAARLNSLLLLVTDAFPAGTLEHKLFDMMHCPLLQAISYGSFVIFFIAAPALLEDSPKLKWSHVWFLLGGAILTLCIGINVLCRFCTHLATMIDRGEVAEPTTDRGTGTDAGLNSDLESQGGVKTATNNAPAWVGRRLLMRKNGIKAIESV